MDAAGGRAGCPARGGAPAEIPAEYLQPGTTLSLGQLIDVALRNNPATREAWHSALAAAAEVGSKRSMYFPYVEIDGSILREKQPLAVGGQFTYLQTTYGPSIAASWLLFNFGGREADVEEATRALYAADWTHNAAIQDVVLSVAQAYYQYLNAKAQVVARQANLEEARKNLAAAEERHRAGVATIADVLQARTAASQVELDLQDAQGQVQIIRGALATAVGVSANVPVDVGELPEELPLDAVKKSVDELIAKALARRPDLAAERFRVLAAESHIHASAIDGLPSLTLDATGNRTFYWRSGGRSLLDQLGGRDHAAHPRLPRIRHGLPGAEGARGGGERPRDGRAHGGPGDPRRLVQLLRRADGVAAREDDARPARERDAVRRGRAGAIQVRRGLDPGSADGAVRSGGRALAGGAGALALVPLDRAARARDGHAGAGLAGGPQAAGDAAPAPGAGPAARRAARATKGSS